MFDLFSQQKEKNEKASELAFGNIATFVASAYDKQSSNKDSPKTSLAFQRQVSQDILNLKNVVSKHQQQVSKITHLAYQFENFKSKYDGEKFLKMQKENYELLRKYIDEVNDYSNNLYQKLVLKLNLKTDVDLFEKFKSNVEEKVIVDLNCKLDKIDHKRLQN